MAQAAMAAGSAIQAVGAIRQGNANANMSEYNAQVADQNAALVQSQAAEAVRRQRIQSATQIGAMHAAYGASGVTADGSALDVLQSSAAKAELDALTIQNQGDIKATAYRNESSLDKYRAGNERIAGYFGGASALLSGGAQVASKGAY